MTRRANRLNALLSIPLPRARVGALLQQCQTVCPINQAEIRKYHKGITNGPKASFRAVYCNRTLRLAGGYPSPSPAGVLCNCT